MISNLVFLRNKRKPLLENTELNSRWISWGHQHGCRDVTTLNVERMLVAKLYIKNHIELACSVRTGNILHSLLLTIRDFKQGLRKCLVR